MDRKKDIKQKFEPFKKKASKDILIKKMILFGSRVKGKIGKDTDADFIIVSPAFKKIHIFEGWTHNDKISISIFPNFSLYPASKEYHFFNKNIFTSLFLERFKFLFYIFFSIHWNTSRAISRK